MAAAAAVANRHTRKQWPTVAAAVAVAANVVAAVVIADEVVAAAVCVLVSNCSTLRVYGFPQAKDEIVLRFCHFAASLTDDCRKKPIKSIKPCGRASVSLYDN